MDLELSWQKGLDLKDDAVDLKSVPTEPGIYVFFRSHGGNQEALYVGKAVNLRVRVKAELNSVSLMTGIKKSQNGKRQLVVGVIKLKQGQQLNRALLTAEKALIRYYLAESHALLNKQGTVIKVHSVKSVRTALKKLIPAQVQLQIN